MAVQKKKAPAKKAKAKPAKAKTVAKKAAPKKAAPKKAVAKRVAPKKVVAKKTAAKKTVAKKAPARAAAKGRKAVAKKAAPKRVTARKAAPKRAAAAKPARQAKHEGTTTHRVALASRLLVRSLSARLNPKGIGYGQFPVLQHLWEEDGLTQKELSNRVRIEAPTMVRTLDRMEREDLVTRIRSETDRRQIHIRLTTKGKGLKSGLASMSGKVDTLALKGISVKDRAQLDLLMGRVIKNLEADTS
jgi:MarR family transcriptional regulator for hemolysin